MRSAPPDTFPAGSAEALITSPEPDAYAGGLDGPDHGDEASQEGHSAPTTPGPNPEARKVMAAAARSGLKSYALTRIPIEVTNFGAVIVLARLVTPTATGHATVALVLPAVAVILTFEGFGAPLVQRKVITSEHLRTSMTLSVITGFGASALLAGLTLAVGGKVFGTKTADLVLVASPIFLIASFGGVSRALLMRDLRFRTMSRRDSLVIVFGNVIAVVLAICGLRASALVYAAVGTMALDTAIMINAARPAGFGWDSRARKDIWSYGAAASLAGLVTVLRRNIDYLILAATSSAHRTGVYYRSFMFGAEYQSKVTNVVVLMLFPLLARSNDEDDLKVIRERSMRANAIVALPLLGIVIALAPDLVPMLYGNNWRSAVVPTQVLSVAGMMQVLLVGADGVPMALGRTALLLRVNLMFLIVYGVGISVAVHFGLIAVCCTATGVYFVMLFLVNYLLVDRLLGLRPGQLFLDAWPALAGTLVCLGIAVSSRVLLEGVVPEIVTVVVSASSALMGYLLTLRFGFRGTWEWLAMTTSRTLSGS